MSQSEKTEYEKLEETFSRTWKNFNAQNNKILALKKEYERRIKQYEEEYGFSKMKASEYLGRLEYGRMRQLEDVVKDLERLLK